MNSNLNYNYTTTFWNSFDWELYVRIIRAKMNTDLIEREEKMLSERKINKMNINKLEENTKNIQPNT
jgi:hypothetical protein